jgi:hypothetical protein
MGVWKLCKEFLEGIVFEATLRLGPELGIPFINSDETFRCHNIHLTFWWEQLKSHIPKAQKKWQTANFCNMNGSPCQDAELKAEKYGEKTL